VAAQDPADGPRWNTQFRAQPILTAPLVLAQRHDRVLNTSAGTARAAVWARGPFLQARLALGPIAGHPAVPALLRHPHLLGHVRDRAATVNDALNQQQTAVHSQTGISVGHQGLRLW